MERKEDATIQDNAIRPRALKDYIGQETIKKNLNIYECSKRQVGTIGSRPTLWSAWAWNTTLAGIIANEMGVDIKITSGPAIEKPCDIVAVLNNLQDGDVVFVDEIHRLNRQVEEILYPAMEDFAIDIMLNADNGKKSLRLDLPKFTLIGATTRAGLLTAPLRDRFGIIQKMEFYRPEELKKIAERTARMLGTEIDDAGAMEIAMRSRGTPRLTNRLVKRVRDFARVEKMMY